MESKKDLSSDAVIGAETNVSLPLPPSGKIFEEGKEVWLEEK